LIAIVLVASGRLNNAVNTEDGRAASASDQSILRLSPELRQVLATSGADDSIKVWVEFDLDEYENKTGNLATSLISQYKRSAAEKMQRGAVNELLPEEIMAVIFARAQAVEAPVELAKHGLSLIWYIQELTPNMIKSITSFPGLQKMTLYKSQDNIPKIDPVLVSYVAKVLEEYPTCKIKLSIELELQFDAEPGVPNYSYEAIRKVLQKYGGEITGLSLAVKDVDAQSPASMQLLAELSALSEAESAWPNWVVYGID
jgi:hypothetical protein